MLSPLGGLYTLGRQPQCVALRCESSMRTATAELSELLQSAAQQFVGVLRRAASGVDGLDTDGLTYLLRVAFTQRNQIDAALTGAVGALDRVAEKAPDGEATMGLSCAEWLSHTLHISSSAGYAQVRLARQLPYLPATASAFERGELSPQHASGSARSVEQVTRGGGDPGDAEALLLEEARQRDPRDLLRWGLSLVHQLAPREMEAEEQRREERRYLHMREVFDGGYTLEGYLDPERGARLKTAIDGVLGPRRKDDKRSPGVRRADGLDDVVTQVLDSGRLPVRGGQRPHLTITATLETLRGDPAAPAGLLDWGFPISGKALRRIASDAELTPILLSRKGDPLHVGRKYRTATPKMRKALAQRDRKCVWPGCSNPPDWCQGHHADRPWALGGGTEVEGMSLLCGNHHGKLDRGWRLQRASAGWVAHPPPRRSGPVWGPAIHDPPPGCAQRRPSTDPRIGRSAMFTAYVL